MARRFSVDGVECASMEGFLQSLKYQDIEKQRYCCTLTGHTARLYGKQAPDWRTKQTLYWNGVEYDRHSDEYRLLIERTYCILFTQSKDAKDALLATGSEILTHTVGNSNPNETILTKKEFCDILTEIRTIFQLNEMVGF